MYKSVSQAEKLFIEQGCAFGIRQDGRGLQDHRNIYIENNIIPQSYGSARVKIADAIDVICSVKAEVTRINAIDQNTGYIEVFTEISPMSNARADDRKLQSMSSNISSVIESSLVESAALDRTKLCIIEGKFGWTIFIDLLVLQYDGDPIDACSLAVFVALKSTRLPKVETFIGESGRDEDFEISGDLSDALPLSYERLPVVITVCKIGSSYVLDCSGPEIACASVILTIAVDDAGYSYGINKILGGSITLDEITKIIQLATIAVKIKIPQIESYFSSNNKAFSNESLFPEIIHPRLGFLA